MTAGAVGKVATVVLAAGRSSRLGRDKRLLLLDGEPLIRRTCRQAVECGIGPVFVVIRAGDLAVMPALEGLAVRCVSIDTAERGMGASIRAGVAAAAESEVDSVIITVCDQSAVTTAHLCLLDDMGRQHDTRAVASRYGGTVGVPAWFRRDMFDSLLTIPESQGAHPILRSLGDAMFAVDLPGGEADIDTPADLDSLV